jgi:hypothetical protein
MKVVLDGRGNPWICDCEADPSKDLVEQKCWQLSLEEQGYWQLREEGSTHSKKRRTP